MPPVPAPRPGEASPAYDVVVLYFRLGETFGETLSALSEQTHQPQSTVLVDNASEDGVVRRLGHGRAATALLELEENLGYGGGMNIGIHHLGDESPYLLLMTHETLLSRDCASRLVEDMQTRALVATGPELRQSDGTPWSFGGYISRGGGAAHHRGEHVLQRPQWLDGACLMIDKRALQQIDGFDERFFLYWEDVDLGLRLSKVGRIGITEGARASQAPSTAHPSAYYYARNRILLWRMRRQWPRVASSVLFCLAYGVYRAIRVDPRDLIRSLRGLKDGLRGHGGPDPHRRTLR